SQRSSSKSLITISRGSKLKIEKGNTIRFFIWWKDVAYNRVDIDLLLVKDTKLVCNSVSDGVDILGNPKMVEECVEIETESKSLSLLVELQRDAIYEIKACAENNLDYKDYRECVLR
ncbi:hypothetical protein LCGC14_3111550, partial [marine sediment metagenome]